ncbi:hypothetical protein KBD34_00705 [Patescibacteria group bacterium]|nr:hypothetical protein [Patescibacteria group bacterium]
MKKIAASFSFAALLFVGSADAQTCRESADDCNAEARRLGQPANFTRRPTSLGATLSPCDPADVSHQRDLASCAATLQRESDDCASDSRRCDDGSRRRRHHGRQHDDVHLQPGDRVVVDAPPPILPAALPVQRVVTSNRDGTARRSAAEANAGVVTVADALRTLARGTQEAVTGLAQAQVEETTQRRAGDAFGLRLTQDVDAMSRQRDQQLGQQQTQTNVVAQGAQTTANEALRADRFELGTFGSFHLNSATGTTLGGLSLCAGWIHSLGASVATRVQGCYSPNLNGQTNAPGVGFLQMGGVAVHALLFPRNRFQLALGARGAMAGSDLVGLTWWSFGVDVGVAFSLTNPTAPGPDVRLELLFDPGLVVSHGLDTANNNAPLHGLGGNVGARFGVTAHF